MLQDRQERYGRWPVRARLPARRTRAVLANKEGGRTPLHRHRCYNNGARTGGEKKEKMQIVSPPSVRRSIGGSVGRLVDRSIGRSVGRSRFSRGCETGAPLINQFQIPGGRGRGRGKKRKRKRRRRGKEGGGRGREKRCSGRDAGENEALSRASSFHHSKNYNRIYHDVINRGGPAAREKICSGKDRITRRSDRV